MDSIQQLVPGLLLTVKSAKVMVALLCLLQVANKLVTACDKLDGINVRSACCKVVINTDMF